MSAVILPAIALITSGCAGIGSASQTAEPGTPPTMIDIVEGTWFAALPTEGRSVLLWAADHEEGNLSDWEDAGTDDYYAGGGVFLTPANGDPDDDQRGAEIIIEPAHSGDYAVAAWITGAIRSENGNRAVRLMRWTNAAWDEDGGYFPADSYYSTWVYLPERYNPTKVAPWDSGDGGWWNIFQFKSDNLAGSQPVAVLNIGWNDEHNHMELYLDTKSYPDPRSDSHTNTSWLQVDPVAVPVGEWFHLEARYVKSESPDGLITIWQDGTLILEATGIRTALSEQTAWGIGNYTDHIRSVDSSGATIGTAGSATIYFDDASVASRPLHPYLTEAEPITPEE